MGGNTQPPPRRPRGPERPLAFSRARPGRHVARALSQLPWAGGAGAREGGGAGAGVRVRARAGPRAGGRGGRSRRLGLEDSGGGDEERQWERRREAVLNAGARKGGAQR